jgi:hypothetical protein
MTRRLNPHVRTLVRIPESDLAAAVRELAAPIIERLGPVPAREDARSAIDLAVAFWNASVLASKRWDRPRVKELNELKKRMRGAKATPGDAELFDLLTERWRKHWLDPRLVKSWTYDTDGAGGPGLVCTTGFPDGVEAEVPPPVENRIAIGGKFLDEVRIAQGKNVFLRFPVDRHHFGIGEDGTVTVRAMMPSALQLFAEGLLPRLGSGSTEISVGGRNFGPMVLTELACGAGSPWQDVAVLVFKPVSWP